MPEQQGRWLAGEIRDDYELRTTISLGTLAGARVISGVERKSGQWHAIKFISSKSDDPTGAREKALTLAG